MANQLFTPEQIAKLRKLGNTGTFLAQNDPNSGGLPTSLHTPDVDSDLAYETTPEIEADAKAVHDLKTEETPGQLTTGLLGQGPFGVLKQITQGSHQPYDYSPLLMAARLGTYNSPDGANYPNGANGFGDPSTFAKGADIAQSKGKSSRKLASKSQPTTSTPTPEKPDLTDIDAGTGTINTLPNMAEAMRTAGNLTMMNEMGKAGDKILAGLTRTNPQFQDQYNEGIQQAQQLPGKFQALAGQEDNDPNSPKSKAFKNYLKTFGINLKGDVSANTAQSLLPAIYKQFEGEQNRQLKQAITQQTMAERASAAEQSNATRALLGQLALQGKQYAADKSLEGRQKSLDASLNKFNTTQQANAQKGLNTDKNYLKYSGQVEEANQVKNLVDDAVQNGGESSKALGIYLARYATGGQRLSVPEIKALGGSAGSWDQRIKNWATELATGKITPDQANMLKKFVNVTGNTAIEAKKNIELDRAHKYQQIRQGTSEGDAYKALTGQDLTQTSPQPSYSQDVIDYAKQHGITPEQANQIKLKRTQG